MVTAEVVPEQCGVPDDGRRLHGARW
jgi:hypothetical protein